MVGKEFALTRYNARLAKIYESEEHISGMPINMSNLQLFSTQRTSSLPLNLAYKAAQLVDRVKADLFLYNLRFATIVECRPTTMHTEIMAVVLQTDIDPKDFARHYDGGSAQAELDEDFRLRQAFGVRGLPAYLFEYEGRSLLANGVLHSADFLQAIEKLTDGELEPVAPEFSPDTIRGLVDRHPLISPIEVREAFGLRDVEEVRNLAQPLVAEGYIRIEVVHHGWFIRKV